MVGRVSDTAEDPVATSVRSVKSMAPESPVFTGVDGREGTKGSSRLEFSECTDVTLRSDSEPHLS